MVSVFPTTEGYTSSCKDKASQKLRMEPKTGTTYNFPKEKPKTSLERKHNPHKAVVDEKPGVMRKRRGDRKHK